MIEQKIEKLIEEIAKIDENRELFFAKELTKKFQNYYRGKAKEILERFKTINSKGEWVVVIRGQKSDVKALYLDDILSFDLKPKDKAKLLSKITNRTTKEWYKKLMEN